ncbi:hypothetical protein KP79_PYT11295 [Mizuhopecten yessoensis]|uniref:Uncharacterized protein n=1 Tax=Mizuhopecten yessoensis TaxID=6573 RepID=A0A210R7H3_MIZYE|nr:hypothetical protein KP79_PYT11295 [Mizuhopecten yessoensis]
MLGLNLNTSEKLEQMAKINGLQNILLIDLSNGRSRLCCTKEKAFTLTIQSSRLTD